MTDIADFDEHRAKRATDGIERLKDEAAQGMPKAMLAGFIFMLLNELGMDATIELVESQVAKLKEARLG